MSNKKITQVAIYKGNGEWDTYDFKAAAEQISNITAQKVTFRNGSTFLGKTNLEEVLNVFDENPLRDAEDTSNSHYFLTVGPNGKITSESGDLFTANDVYKAINTVGSTNSNISGINTVTRFIGTTNIARTTDNTGIKRGDGTITGAIKAISSDLDQIQSKMGEKTITPIIYNEGPMYGSWSGTSYQSNVGSYTFGSTSSGVAIINASVSATTLGGNKASGLFLQKPDGTDIRLIQTRNANANPGPWAGLNLSYSIQIQPFDRIAIKGHNQGSNTDTVSSTVSLNITLLSEAIENPFTDLKNTNWSLQTANFDSVLPVPGKTYNLSFTSNSQNYTSLSSATYVSSGRTGYRLFYDDIKVYEGTAYSINPWISSYYQNLEITGGTDSTDEDLIKWFVWHGTQTQS